MVSQPDNAGTEGGRFDEGIVILTTPLSFRPKGEILCIRNIFFKAKDSSCGNHIMQVGTPALRE
uniref:Uncharacterized protein n=1 Tax=Candidatus Kentrum sp. SD TaxID=2126332 RepID=A0A450Y6Y2_9GAMM|nr:MAG: hypothetical protein BECKSD772F_GA0070984_101341 [Candidatus Kentron sp. SD]VFK42374.1 MAG: hypothetical protein BECKSD772E_GA0070983_101637 [Candidatus Kentron sp. SD]VFK79439.1 MAG: hypothetical protein BECKSD772D_GA0070982_10505 [Candidatus Kentron sp. SD]